MKAKGSKLQKKKRSALFWLSIIALPLAIAVGAVWLDNYNYDQRVDREEDLTFAKMEGYINLIKKQLDREIPEGDWEVIKECVKPGTKLDMGKYSCTYGVKSISGSDFKNQFGQSLKAYFFDQQINIKPDDVSGYEKPSGTSGCNVFYGRGADDYSSVRCSATSHSIRYDLLY